MQISRKLYFQDKLDGETRIRLLVDSLGKSSIICEKGGKTLKSIPPKFKKNEIVLKYQEIHKQLKEQYSRTRQMMEQAMEDRTVFEAWELLELQKNPVARPIVEPLIFQSTGQKPQLGFLTESGLLDCQGTLTELSAHEELRIAHPWICTRQESGMIIKSCCLKEKFANHLNKYSANCM